MIIYINNKATTITAPATIAVLVDKLKLSPPFAIALNRTFIPKTAYAQTLIVANDEIDVVHPVTGG